MIAAVIGVIGSWIPSFWGDEAASVMSASRTWPQLWRMLQTVDGVHGAYYAFLHVWTGLFGTSEFSVRLPSALAVGFLAAGTVSVTGRFGGRRLALTAGLVCALLPRTVLMGAEARSYAIGSAIAVWLTVLLVVLLARQSRWWLWAGYAAGIAVSIYVFLYLALLLAVHGLFLAVFHRRLLWRWARWSVLGIGLAMPMILLAAAERNQIGFLAARDYITPVNVLALQWFDPVTAWPCGVLIVIGLVASLRPPHDAMRVRLAVLALTWLALPTAAVLIGSALIAPMYTVRYLSFCTPAAAILVAVGVRTVGRFLAGRTALTPTAATGTVLAVVLVSFLPNAVVQRGPYAKDGSDWREAAAYLHAHAGTGDAVLFDERPKPSQKPRLIPAVYPADFAGLTDPALLTSFRYRAGLWDATRPNASITLAELTTDVWLLQRGQDAGHSPDVRRLEALGYRVVSSHRITVTVVLHLQR